MKYNSSACLVLHVDSSRAFPALAEFPRQTHAYTVALVDEANAILADTRYDTEVIYAGTYIDCAMWLITRSFEDYPYSTFDSLELMKDLKIQYEGGYRWSI